VLSIGVLGPVEAWRAGEPIPLAGLRQRALLAALAMEPGRLVGTSVLCELVWPAPLPANPVGALHQQVFKLRRRLGEGSVRRGEHGYRLAVDEEAVDARRFEALLGRARAELPARAPAAEALCAEGLGLWRGRALEELAEFEWASIESRRLAELRLDALELRAQALLALDRAGEAAGEMDRVLREAPLREHACALRMLALAGAGRRADALEAYHEARERLVGELGVEPGPELRSVQAQILGRDATT
jgi:DNA-binding SARP family transcriptional activator